VRSDYCSRPSRLSGLSGPLATAALTGLSLGAALARAEPTPSSFDLYLSGQTSQALADARLELERAERNSAPAAHWQHLMYVAWLEESVGEHRSSMSHATRALDVAATLDDPFRTGRSLCWLGWSATSLGLYPLALEFYGDAIAIGTRDGAILYPAVWGLATQETGALLARMGRLDEGAAHIETTLDYARRHGIRTGVAEGGAHLARIALARGELQQATELADEAVRAAEDCACSAYNTNRARLVQARTLLEKARTNPKLEHEAQRAIETALAGAEQVSDRRHIAEARLLLSRAIDPDELERRTQLVTSAVDLLHATESELRGSAEAQLGSLLLESDREQVAAVYLRSGLELNEELLRKLDSAYILGDLAEIDSLAEDARASLSKWMEAATRAESSGAWPLAAESQERLSEDLQALGFLSLAIEWTDKALDSLDRLLESASEPERRQQLARRRLLLSERLVERELELAHAPPRAPSPRAPRPNPAS
jgi:tetratricopeptide (TPR) repeat protein